MHLFNFNQLIMLRTNYMYRYNWILSLNICLDHKKENSTYLIIKAAGDQLQRIEY